MSEPNLKPKQYYIDLYDRHTVDQCRRTEKICDKDDSDSLKDEKVTKEQALAVKNYVRKFMLRLMAGERYLNKESTIREWMDRDQKRDELYESAQAPEDIRCLTCRNRLKPTFKDLWFGDDKKEDRVLFMYDCQNQCLPRRAFFSDGEE